MERRLPPGHLPPELVARLKRAAAEPDPLRRVRRIDEAYRYADETYPQYLKGPNMQMLLANVRLAFPVLFEAKTVNGEGEPAFSASFLLHPDDPQVAAVKAAIDDVAKAKWGAKTDAVMKELRAKDRLALHDGDLKANYAGFEGMMFVAARSKLKPLVIDQGRRPLVAADGRPYAGCYVNAQIELYAQDNNYGKRVNASLLGVQFVRDGDAFAGGAPATPEAFPDMTDGVDASEFA